MKNQKAKESPDRGSKHFVSITVVFFLMWGRDKQGGAVAHKERPEVGNFWGPE